MKRSVERPLKGPRGAKGFKARWWRIDCDHPGCHTTTFCRALKDVVEKLACEGWRASRKANGQDWCAAHKPPPERPKPVKPTRLIQQELFP